MSDSRRRSCKLTRALDPGTLRDILVGLAQSTGTTAAVVCGPGEPVVGPTPGSPIGHALAASPAGAAAQKARIETAAANGTNDAPRMAYDDEPGLCHLVIPINAGRHRRGVLVLGDRPSRPWTEDDCRRLAERWQLSADALLAATRQCDGWPEEQRTVCKNLGVGVASLLARLCLQDQQLQHRVDELSAIYDMAGMLAGTRDLQEVLDLTARKVCEVMQTKACSIRLLDEQTRELVIKAVYNLSERYLNKGPVLVDRHPIDAEAIQGKVVYIEDAPNDPRVRYPVDARQEGIVSGLVAGMMYRGRPVGVIRVYTATKHRFNRFEEALLRAVAAQAAVAIVNTRLYHAAIEAERNKRQLKYAGDVQRRMIPPAPPEREGAVFGCVYKPSREVGGDFYDFIDLPGGNIGVAIADVSGKGLPAALTMASLRSALRVYTYHIYDVERIMTQVNDHLCRETRTNEFATLFYGVLTPDARRLTYCNAGHEPPLLLRDGHVQELQVGGMVIGVVQGEPFEKAILELRPGDLLLLYTDGVVESLNFAEEQFGRRRLAESLKAYAHLAPAQIVNNIVWDVRRFIGLSDLADDMTLVAIKVK